MTKGVLAGKTVVELGSMIAAPFATHILQQLGAEVIKIEPPAGETTRKLVRGGPSGSYLAFNRSKKSLCLDLQSEDGREIFRRLIAEAATGVMFSNRVDGRPSRLGPSYHDQFAGGYAVIAVLSALLSGEDDKRNIELGLYETGLHIAARDLLGVQLKSQFLGRPETEPSAEFSIPGYGAYETSDGRWVYLVMLTDDHWRRFCAATGVDPDPALATLRARRRERPHVEAIVRDAIAQYDYAHLAETLSTHGVGFTEILATDRVLSTPQAQDPGKVTEFGFSDYVFQSPDFPLPGMIGDEHLEASPPLLGADTASLLAQLGYDRARIDALLATGAARSADETANLWARPKRPVREVS